jgi:NDP-sugar pyrophosphorylase family protein
MKAMILAAGLGTRLKPLTDDKPKALVELAGKPMLQWAIEKLTDAGINEIVINIHHYPDQILSFLRQKKNFGIQIHISDERDLLLDSGGGIKKAEPFLAGHPFLVYNVDVITDLDLRAMAAAHESSLALASLAVRPRETSRYLLFDDSLRLRAWQNKKSGEYSGDPAVPGHPFQCLAFSGISLFSADIFEHITETGAFPLVGMLLRLAPQHLVRAYVHEEGYWFDLGSQSNIEKAALFLNRH